MPTLGTHPKNTGLFLDSLAAIDLVEKKDGCYQNVPASSAFLVENSPTYMGPVFNYYLSTYGTYSIDELLDLVKKGPDSHTDTNTISKAFEEFTEDEEELGLLDQGFLADAMLRAGFKSVRSKTIDTDWGKEDIDIGRK